MRVSRDRLSPRGERNPLSHSNQIASAVFGGRILVCFKLATQSKTLYNIGFRYYNPSKEVILLQDKLHRKLFLGFIQMHILHHAQKEPIYGVWMMEELREHGYTISPGTLYPILHEMESLGLLLASSAVANGKTRKYYAITPAGIDALEEGAAKAKELLREIGQ